MPAAGAIPSTAVIYDNTTVGGLNFTPLTGGGNLHITNMEMSCTAIATLPQHVIITDRLCAMGGLSGIVITAQTVNLSLTGVASDRLGANDNSEIEWYVEVYTALGATSTTCTVAFTHTDTTTSTHAFTTGPSPPAGRLFLIVPTAGKRIASVQSVTLTASTLTAGNFGVTAMRPITSGETPAWQNASPVIFDAAKLGFPVISSTACLVLNGYPSATSIGAVFGKIVLAQG